MAVLILSPPADKKISLTDPVTKKIEEKGVSDFKSDFSGYVILIKELTSEKKKSVAAIGFLVHFAKANGSMRKYL